MAHFTFPIDFRRSSSSRRLISGEVQAVGQNSGSEAQWMLSSQQAQPTSGQLRDTPLEPSSSGAVAGAGVDFYETISAGIYGQNLNGPTYNCENDLLLIFKI
jgi:hypothetical protein